VPPWSPPAPQGRGGHAHRVSACQQEPPQVRAARATCCTCPGPAMGCWGDHFQRLLGWDPSAGSRSTVLHPGSGVLRTDLAHVTRGSYTRRP
jgi:hypothetical protein